MGRAKEIIVKVIPSKIANEFVKKNHYSGKVVPNSSLHFGCFLDDKLHGVLSYGTSMDKRKILPLVENSGWNNMLELNRMAFDEYLPKYSESRCIAITIKLLKKNAPHIKWILSYSDGTQCGDGTIYRASGFLLTGLKENKTILKWEGKIIADKTLNNSNYKKLGISAGYAKKNGAIPLNGFQLRYIYLIDKTCKITVPILPFSKIDEMSAGMYKGQKISLAERKALSEVVESNANFKLEA
tara:strand:+ start:653 stop:1375 length:723 start_codon:yes stop_codon:yes gene_type:complete